MKPLQSEQSDPATLQQLGRASAQVVHDIKNQLNGLKLYATFLRKRLEKRDSAADELETVNKLIDGLERASADASILVRYSREVELRLQSHVDLRDLLVAAAPNVQINVENEGEQLSELTGTFDRVMLTEALKEISIRAGKNRTEAAREETQIHVARQANEALIEWRNAAVTSGESLFDSFIGSAGLRLALAAKIITAHGGTAEADENTLRVRLPLDKRN